MVADVMGEPYTLNLQPKGAILLNPEAVLATEEADAQQDVIRAIWRTRSMGLSRTEAQCVLPDLEDGVTVAQCNRGLKELAIPASVPIDIPGTVPISGAMVDLEARVHHLLQARNPPPLDIMQPGHASHHWITMGVDGTSRHNTTYVHGVLGLEQQCSRQASWWLAHGSER